MEKQTRTFKKVEKEVTFAALKRGCDGLHHGESKQICVFTCNRIFSPLPLQKNQRLLGK